MKRFDVMKIVNRIVTAVLAAVSFPLLLTQIFIDIVLSVNENSTAYTLIKSFLGEDNQLINNRLGFQESLIDLFNLITGKTESSFGIDFKSFFQNLPAELEPLKNYAIAAAVFICLGVFIAVVVIGCALFTRAYKTIIGLSLGSSLCFLIAIIVFGQGTKPLLDGTIDVAGIVMQLISTGESSTLGSIASSVLAGAINVDTFAFGGGVFGPMIMMFATAMWELAYYITLPSNEKPNKKLKKA